MAACERAISSFTGTPLKWPEGAAAFHLVLRAFARTMCEMRAGSGC